jgi:segregation and condensation protein B
MVERRLGWRQRSAAPRKRRRAQATDAGSAPAQAVKELLAAAAPSQAPSEVEAGGLSPLELRATVEALIFASPEPLTPRQLGQVLAGVEKADWQQAIAELREEYTHEGRGLQLVEVAGGFQITTRPEHHDWVRELLDPKTPTRLSIQALETLAVIAYKQPVTLPEIIELRGVKSAGVIKTLLEKHLIRIVGRKEVVGRPMLYGTTKQFLLHFGLKDLSELPSIEEFADVLGEEVDVVGLKRAIETPKPVDVALAENEPVAEEKGAAAQEEAASTSATDEAPDDPSAS